MKSLNYIWTIGFFQLLISPPTFQGLRLEPGVGEVRVVRDFERHDESLREGGQHRLKYRLAHSLPGIVGWKITFKSVKW